MMAPVGQAASLGAIQIRITMTTPLTLGTMRGMVAPVRLQGFNHVNAARPDAQSLRMSVQASAPIAARAQRLPKILGLGRVAITPLDMDAPQLSWMTCPLRCCEHVRRRTRTC